MFTITNKLRILIALGAVGATVGSAAVASAATVGHRPITITPIVVNHPMAAHNTPVAGAGSAGITGYDDAKCESLAHDYNTATSYGDQPAQAGDLEGAASNYTVADQIYTQMSDNRMVMD